MTLRILIADDHALVRSGFRALLERTEGIVVVDEACNGRDALEKARSLRPDIILMDINMPGLNGLDAVEILSREQPETRVIILSMHANEKLVWRALQANACGYLLKGSSPDELRMAIQAVANGQIYLSPAVSRQVLANYIRGQAAQSSVGNRQVALTPRQREILNLIADGFTTKEIAARLDISPKTVEFHRDELMKKLGARNMAHLVHLAVEQGLIWMDG